MNLIMPVLFEELQQPQADTFEGPKLSDNIENSKALMIMHCYPVVIVESGQYNKSLDKIQTVWLILLYAKILPKISIIVKNSLSLISKGG